MAFIKWLWFAVACSLLLSCSSAASDAPGESLASIAQPVTAEGSLVKEHQESIPNAVSAVVGALEWTEGNGDDRRSRFVVALQGTNPSGLRVQLRSLQDLALDSLGVGLLVDEDAVLVANMTRLRIVPLGPLNFVVVTRENNRMILRSFVVIPPRDSHGTPILDGEDTASLELKDTVDSGEDITQLAATRVFQKNSEVLQLATVIQKSDNKTRVISWLVDFATGVMTRQATSVVPTAGSASRLAAASPERPWGVMVTAETLANSTALTPWKIDTAGAITRNSLKIKTLAAATDVSAVRAGYASVAIGLNPTSGTVAQVALYDISSTFDLTARSTVSFGNGSSDPRGVELAYSTGSRLFVTGTTATGGWTARTWTTISSLVQTSTFVGSGTSYAVTSAATVKADRLVLTALNSSGGVELVTFRDYHTPLIRADFAGSGGSIPADPVTAVSFKPGVSAGPELLIAASEHFVVTCDTGKCKYYDKAGNGLGGALLLRDRSTPGILDPLKGDLYKHLQVQYMCDPVNPDPDDACPMGAVYDTKLFYASTISRFIIVASIKATGGDNRMRHTLFAVSKTEDPRGGYYLYAIGDSLIRDNLQAAAGGGMLIIAHGGSSESGLRPNAFLLDLRDLAANTGEIQSSKLSAVHTGATGNLLVPLQYSPDPQNTELGFLESRPPAGNVFAFWRHLNGPIAVSSRHVFSPQLDSGNKLEIDSMEVVDNADGFATATLYDAGPAESDITLQRGIISLNRAQQATGQGITDVRVVLKTFPCPQKQSGEHTGPFTCAHPTVAARDGRFLVNYMRRRIPEGPYDVSACASYFTDWIDAPIFKKIAEPDGESTKPWADLTAGFQTYNAVPDPAGSWSGDFWPIGVVTDVVTDVDGNLSPRVGRVFR